MFKFVLKKTKNIQGQKTGLFLTVDNFTAVSGRNACDMPSSDGQIPIAIRFKSRLNYLTEFDMTIKDSIFIAAI